MGQAMGSDMCGLGAGPHVVARSGMGRVFSRPGGPSGIGSGAMVIDGHLGVGIGKLGVFVLGLW